MVSFNILDLLVLSKKNGRLGQGFIRLAYNERSAQNLCVLLRLLMRLMPKHVLISCILTKKGGKSKILICRRLIDCYCKCRLCCVRIITEPLIE
jgi:hypothetical protein